MSQTITEDTIGAAAPDIATVDHNLSVSDIFQQMRIPSLGRQIFSILPIKGPNASIFNLRNKAGTNDVELVKASVAVYPSTAIKTNITSEAVQDIRAMYGKEADPIIGKLLRGLANVEENNKTLEFLDLKSVAFAALVLTVIKNAETNLFEIGQRVQEIVLKMNTKNLRTYQAFAVLPYNIAASIMALSRYQIANVDDIDHGGLFVAQFGATRYYFNPNPASTTVYVGLMDTSDSSKSSAIFSQYTSDVVESQHPDTGVLSYHIFNRFAITASPLHVATDEMLYKFTVNIV